MPKNNKEKATDAWTNPPHPGDPTSDVTRQDHTQYGGSSGEALHRPPMPGAEVNDETGEWESEGDREVREREEADRKGEEYVGPAEGERAPTRNAGASVPAATGRDAAHDGHGGPADASHVQTQEYQDDPMPDKADERVDWAERGSDGPARANAALHAEHNRAGGPRSTVIRKLEKIRDERKNAVIKADEQV